MKYYEFQFQLIPSQDAECNIDTASDILSAMLADVGFEAFESNETGVTGYIQTTLYDEEALGDCLSCFPLTDYTIETKMQEAEYANWNEQWEKEGFQPIVIGDDLCVHDAAHTTLPDTGEPLPKTRYELIVSPRLAFGTGTHPTTRQLLEVLLRMDVKEFHVIDAGCGTGILGMLCLLRGAKKVSAYDIDEWSANNARENAELNCMKLNVWLGDASVLPEVTLQEGKANLLIANINRNILLNDMQAFCTALQSEGGQLLLSGFYEEDIPYLTDKATSLGLIEKMRLSRDGWAVLLFGK